MLQTLLFVPSSLFLASPTLHSPFYSPPPRPCSTHHKLGIGVDGASREGYVLPGDDDGVLGLEDHRAHHPLAYVPHEPLTKLHAELVLARRQVTLESVAMEGDVFKRQVMETFLRDK